MPEKEKDNEQETKTTFTFTVLLVKLLVFVSAVGLVWILQMLIMQSDMFDAILREMAWR